MLFSFKETNGVWQQTFSTVFCKDWHRTNIFGVGLARPNEGGSEITSFFAGDGKKASNLFYVLKIMKQPGK